MLTFFCVPTAAKADNLFDQWFLQAITNPDGDTCEWPAVVMADGLEAAAQTDVIDSVGRVDRMMRKSTAASVAIKPARKSPAKDGLFRIYDYYFVVYGTLDQLADEQILSELVASEKSDDQKSKTNPSEDLGKFKGAQYTYSEQTLMKKVRLHSVVRSQQEKGGESLYAGALVMPDGPKGQKKTEWSPVDKPDAFKPYGGMGVFTKATKLKGTPGAIFVETHLVFYEPEGWFRGRNLLGSKLAPMITNQVKTLRRKLAKPADKR